MLKLTFNSTHRRDSVVFSLIAYHISVKTVIFGRIKLFQKWFTQRGCGCGFVIQYAADQYLPRKKFKRKHRQQTKYTISLLLSTQPPRIGPNCGPVIDCTIDCNDCEKLDSNLLRRRRR